MLLEEKWREGEREREPERRGTLEDLNRVDRNITLKSTWFTVEDQGPGS